MHTTRKLVAAPKYRSDWHAARAQALTTAVLGALLTVLIAAGAPTTPDNAQHFTTTPVVTR